MSEETVFHLLFGGVLVLAVAFVARAEISSAMKGRWRIAVDVACIAAVIAVLLSAPFQFRAPNGVYHECRNGAVFSPPTRGNADLLCSINMQQLSVRLVLVLAAWGVIRARLPK